MVTWEKTALTGVESDLPQNVENTAIINHSIEVDGREITVGFYKYIHSIEYLTSTNYAVLYLIDGQELFNLEYTFSRNNNNPLDSLECYFFTRKLKISNDPNDKHQFIKLKIDYSYRSNKYDVNLSSVDHDSLEKLPLSAFQLTLNAGEIAKTITILSEDEIQDRMANYLQGNATLPLLSPEELFRIAYAVETYSGSSIGDDVFNNKEG